MVAHKVLFPAMACVTWVANTAEKLASLSYAEYGSFVYMLALLTSIIVMYVYCVKKPHIYLVDYSCGKLPDDDKTSLEMMLFFLKNMGTMDDKDIMFQNKIFLKSGVGEEAYVPRANLEKGRLLTMQDSYNQAHFIIIGAVSSLIKKTGISPSQIDIVVVNCGLFNPTPSLTSLLINRFKMRADVKSFHLAGMGCSAGLISLTLAADLLKVHKEARYALVASAEVIQVLYDGKERGMMVTNCLFRSAGNAVLLSNRKEDKKNAKMELMHTVRLTTAAQDDSHNIVAVEEDKEGLWGVYLSHRLIKVAGEALAKNIERLAPKVLPLGELCKAAWNKVQRDVLKRKGVKPFVPNFKRVFQHFCIHPGGKGVVEGVGKGLNLSPYDIEPSAMTLHRFGNTSCSGVWYTLGYLEAKQRLRKDNKVWQIGLGSGFKCNSVVWKVLRDLEFNQELHFDNPWHDCVHRYPVNNDLASLPHVVDFVDFLHKILDVPSPTSK